MTIDRFLTDLDEMGKLFPEDYISYIVNSAFEDNQSCTCTYEGTNDYFSTSQMQWYPGDEPEYEVDGYDDYINSIVDIVVSDYVMEYKVDRDDALIKDIHDNLDIILDCNVLSESEFEEKAIEQFINTH